MRDAADDRSTEFLRRGPGRPLQPARHVGQMDVVPPKKRGQVARRAVVDAVIQSLREGVAEVTGGHALLIIGDARRRQRVEERPFSP